MVAGFLVVLTVPEKGQPETLQVLVLIAVQNLREKLFYKKDKCYSRGENIAIGISEIAGGCIIAAGSIMGAGAIDVASCGVASAHAGWAVLGGWSAGSTFIGFGITRLTNTNNYTVSNDINSVFIPSFVGISQDMNSMSNGGI